MHDLTIKVALNGYVVRVGCQRVVFNNRDHMLRALNDYLDDPDAVSTLYQRNSLNSKQLGFVRKESNCGCDAEPTAYACDPED